jgi:tellurite resistance protein TerA
MAIDYNKRPGASPPDAGGGVSLSKVTLTKAAPSVSLTKRGQAGGQLRVNLQWSTGAPQKKGLFGRLSAGAGAIDLDLACLWEFSDGSKGVVQALGNAFQAPYQGAPIIRLDGDDRSGSNAAGENMFIDLSRVNEIRRILVFAFIYDGVPAWDKADGVVTLFPQGEAPIEIRLDESSGSRMCALALLENTGGALNIRREVRYIDGAQDKLDQAYGWGMDWTPGRK